MKDLNWIPKKYQERVYSIEREDGLIDNCKYIVYFMNNYCFEGYSNVPVKNKKEVLYFIKMLIRRCNCEGK